MSEWTPILRECPACGHKGGYCTAKPDRDGNDIVIKCRRNAKGRPCKVDGAGPAWLFLASSLQGGAAAMALPPKGRREQPRLKHAECVTIQKRLRSAVDRKRLADFAAEMGLSVPALDAFGIGWDAERRTWTWPMVDPARRIIGFRVRYTCRTGTHAAGDKACMPGSRNGLFVPEDYEAFAIPAGVADDPCPLLLLLPEGPTDAAAARDMGFRSIGRPNNAGGFDMARHFLLDKPPQEVVIVADRDETKYLRDGTPFWPGEEGALSGCLHLLGVELIEAKHRAHANHLCASLKGAAECTGAQAIDVYHGGRARAFVVKRFGKPACGRLQFMLPPEGTKDLRAWLKGGTGGEGVTSLVNERWLATARLRLADRKTSERKGNAA